MKTSTGRRECQGPLMDEICAACNGAGFIPNPDLDPRDPNSPDSIPCNVCGGDGWIR